MALSSYFLLIGTYLLSAQVWSHQDWQCGFNVQMKSAWRRSNSTSPDYLMEYISNAPYRQETLDLEFPWQVRLQIFGDDGFYYGCGATVIDRYWVITSAQCALLASKPRQIVAVFGLQDTLRPSHREFAIMASKAFVHQLYNEETFNFDFAMLRMSRAIDFTHVRPICLPESCTPDDSCQPGDFAIVTGWGISEGLDAATTVLRKDIVQLSGDVSCLFSYPYDRNMFTHQKWCVGFPLNRMPTCSGDDGGPMVCLKKVGRTYRYQLAGVTSWTYHTGCSQYHRSAYQGFGRVCNVIRWIRSIIERDPHAKN